MRRGFIRAHCWLPWQTTKLGYKRSIINNGPFFLLVRSTWILWQLWSSSNYFLLATLTRLFISMPSVGIPSRENKTCQIYPCRELNLLSGILSFVHVQTWKTLCKIRCNSICPYNYDRLSHNICKGSAPPSTRKPRESETLEAWAHLAGV